MHPYVQFEKVPDVPCYVSFDCAFALLNLYKNTGAWSLEDRVSALEKALGGQHAIYAMGGEVSPEMRLAIMEHAYLQKLNLLPIYGY